MQILIAGSGNVATLLAKKIHNAKGVTLCGIYSRNKVSGMALAKLVDVPFVGKQIPPGTNVIIIAVSDDYIHEILTCKAIDKELVVHTAGAVDSKVLQEFKNHGVFYPVQTITKLTATDVKMPVLLHANNEENTLKLEQLAKAIGSEYGYATDEERLKYHVAAVFVNNFSTYLNSIAYDLLEKTQGNFTLLHPLIMETAIKSVIDNPADIQTGPAKRNDMQTLKKHLTVLKDDNQLTRLYTLISNGIAGKEILK